MTNKQTASMIAPGVVGKAKESRAAAVVRQNEEICKLYAKIASIHSWLSSSLCSPYLIALFTV